MANHVSALKAARQIERRTEVNLSGDLHGGRRNVSEHVNYRRAAPADVLRRMRTGEAVLVYGNELPAHVRLRRHRLHDLTG